VIPIIDISDEDTVPYPEHFNPYDSVEEVIDLEPPSGHPNPEIIDLEPPSPVNDNNETLLEPLDPDIEYQQNIHRMFITLDEYARNVFLNTLDN